MYTHTALGSKNPCRRFLQKREPGRIDRGNLFQRRDFEDDDDRQPEAVIWPQSGNICRPICVFMLRDSVLQRQADRMALVGFTIAF